jgi:hypothetical protein
MPPASVGATIACKLPKLRRTERGRCAGAYDLQQEPLDDLLGLFVEDLEILRALAVDRDQHRRYFPRIIAAGSRCTVPEHQPEADAAPKFDGNGEPILALCGVAQRDVRKRSWKRRAKRARAS